MKYFLFIVTSVISAPAASATDRVDFQSVLNQVTVEQPACFGREYSTKYMESKTAQTVKQFRAKLIKDDQPGSDVSFLQVEASLKGEANLYKVWRAYMICTNSTGHCAVECDGGSVDLWGNRDGTLSLKNNGFVIQGDCGEDDNAIKTIFLKPTRGGDDQFTLSRLPNEFCQN